MWRRSDKLGWRENSLTHTPSYVSSEFCTLRCLVGDVCQRYGPVRLIWTEFCLSDKMHTGALCRVFLKVCNFLRGSQNPAIFLLPKCVWSYFSDYHMRLGALFFKKKHPHTVAEFDFVVCAYQHWYHVICSHIGPWSRGHLLSGNNADNCTVPSFHIFSQQVGSSDCSLMCLVIMFLVVRPQVSQHFFTGNTNHLKPRKWSFCEMSGNSPRTIQDQTLKVRFEFRTFSEQVTRPHSHRYL